MVSAKRVLANIILSRPLFLVNKHKQSWMEYKELDSAVLKIDDQTNHSLNSGNFLTIIFFSSIIHLFSIFKYNIHIVTLMDNGDITKSTLKYYVEIEYTKRTKPEHHVSFWKLWGTLIRSRSKVCYY